MHNDDVARLIDFKDLVGEVLIHAVVVGPLHSLLASVRRLMLFVVEEGVEIMLGIPPPPVLVPEMDTFAGSFVLVKEPYRYGADRLVMGELVLELLLILLGHPMPINWWWRRQSGRRIDRDGSRERIQGRNAHCCRGRCLGRREGDLCREFDLARPGDDGMVPWRGIGREVGKRVEESRLAATRLQVLHEVRFVSALYPPPKR
jgi:hypothetical protein